MTPLSAADKARLARLAEKATPGPWAAIKSCSYCGPHVRAHGMESAVLYGRPWTAARKGTDDVNYAAAASPDVMKALLAENEALRDAAQTLCNLAEEHDGPRSAVDYHHVMAAVKRLRAALGVPE